MLLLIIVPVFAFFFLSPFYQLFSFLYTHCLRRSFLSSKLSVTEGFPLAFFYIKIAVICHTREGLAKE